MRLFENNTGRELKEGDQVTTFRDEKVELAAIYEPETSAGGRGGRIKLKGQPGLYFPSVIGATFRD
jgi:hypothetical protein